MIRTPRWLAVIGGVFVAGGVATVGAAIGAGIRSPAAPTVVSDVYTASSPCTGCPAGTRVASVEVQHRQGSTLFVLRGTWPSSVDALGASVCLNANDIRIALKPHGSGNLFEPAVSTAGSPSTGVPLAQAVAGGIQDGALLIDLQSPLQPTTPVTFDVALCSASGATLQRVPSVGELRWSGSGAPKPVAATSSFAPVNPDPTALPATCAGVPSGTVPPFLQMTGSSSAVQTDPRTGKATQEVTATLSASPAGQATTPFSIAATVLPQGIPSVLGPTRIVDRAGTVQLYAFSDGQHLHKALRMFTNGTWTALLDSSANAMTFRLGPGGASFFWSGIHPGDRFGFITAASTGCTGMGLNPVFVPQLVVTP